jgi:EmrB/QacA subfamily drug resistance transporter
VAPTTVLVIAAAGVFMEFVDSTIVNIAVPSIRRSFPGTPLAEISWTLNAYSIVFASFLVAGGRLADLLGRKKVFEAGVIVFTAGSALCAASPSVGFLIGARVLQAAGGALVVPAAIGLVLHSFPPERRAHAVGMWGAAASLAGILGAPLGGLMIAIWNWRLAFLINVPIGVATILLARGRLIESRAPGRRTLPDLTGSLLLAVAIGSLVLGLVKGSEWQWSDARVIASFAVAVAAGAVFARRCARHSAPVIDPRLLRVRAFAIGSAGTVVASVGFYAYLLCHVLFLTTIWRYSAVQAGCALLPGALVGALVGRSVGGVITRFGFRSVVVVGSLIWAGALLYYVLRIGTRPAFVSEWLPGQVVQGLGASLTLAPLGGAAMLSVPGNRFGSAGAVISSVRQVGAAVGVALLIAVAGAAPHALDAFRSGWALASICFALVAAIALALGRPPAGAATQALPEPPEPARTEPGAALGPPHALAVPVAREPNADVRDATPMELLARVPMFAGVPEERLRELAGRGETVSVTAGHDLFRAGEAADSLYVVRYGRLDVVVDGGREVVARVVGRGAVLGELGLITGSPRSASVRARRDSELLRVGRDDFVALLREESVALSVVTALGAQLQGSRGVDADADGRAPGTVALVGDGDGVPVRRVGERLALALGRVERVAMLDRSTREPRAQRLAELEAECDQVLLVSDGGDGSDPWTGFCLRQADRVLVLSNGSGDGTLRVRAAGGAAFAVHEDPDLEAGVEAIARRLTRRSVGLVLSGGGARALAHVGVLQELLAAGVAVDRVGGAGVGSLIGAMFAAGMSIEEIDARCYEEFVRRSPFRDYAPRRSSLIRGVALRRMLERTFGDLAIEDLDREFYAVSADLRSGSLVMHREGRLVDVLCGSLCIPGLMAPAHRDGALLIDATALEPLPVAPMIAANEGPVVASDACSSARPPLEELGLADTLVRSMLMGRHQSLEDAARRADIVIAPADEGVGMLEFHQYDTMLESGRRAARAAMRGAALPS